MNPEAVVSRQSPQAVSWDVQDFASRGELPDHEVVDAHAAAQACAGLPRPVWLALRWVVLGDRSVGLELAGHLAVWLAGNRRPGSEARRIARAAVIEAATPAMARLVDRDAVRRMLVAVDSARWRLKAARRYELAHGRLMDWCGQGLAHVRRRTGEDEHD